MVRGSIPRGGTNCREVVEPGGGQTHELPCGSASVVLVEQDPIHQNRETAAHQTTAERPGGTTARVKKTREPPGSLARSAEEVFFLYRARRRDRRGRGDGLPLCRLVWSINIMRTGSVRMRAREGRKRERRGGMAGKTLVVVIQSGGGPGEPGARPWCPRLVAEAARKADKERASAYRGA